MQGEKRTQPHLFRFVLAMTSQRIFVIEELRGMMFSDPLKMLSNSLSGE